MALNFSRLRAAFAAMALGLAVAGCGYNTIPTAEENAKAKWADVQNQYQRRADLIPNLVATVQGYAKQEKDVLTSIIEPILPVQALQMACQRDDAAGRMSMATR